MPIDEQTFRAALDEVLHGRQLDEGVGVLSERTLHAVLKRCYEPFEGSREVRLGRYIADIFGEDGVIEIQTGGFYPLREKLREFLSVTPVTVVHPIARRRRLCWVDAKTGAVEEPKPSPRRGYPCEIFGELHWIEEFLDDPNLRVHLLMVDLDEYREFTGYGRNGRKIRGKRVDRIPTAIAEQTVLERPEDYVRLLPESLEDGFGSADFARAAHVDRGTAQTALRILTGLGALRRDRDGRTYKYSFNW